NTCRFSTPVTIAIVSPARQWRHASASCRSTTSGFATGFNVSPACPACPPLVLPDLPRVLPAMRGGFFMPSLDGGLLLLELFLSSCRRRSATSWRKAAFSIRKTSISRCSAEIRSRISCRRIIHTLTHTSPSRVPKNRGPSRSFTKTVANQTHPSLGVTQKLFRYDHASRPSAFGEGHLSMTSAALPANLRQVRLE